LDRDTVDIIRRNGSVQAGSSKDFFRIIGFTQSIDLDSDTRFEEYAHWLDVVYFTDYYIASTYMCNIDMLNQKYWRSQDYSLKWRPVFFDLDFGFTSSETRSILSQYFRLSGVEAGDGSVTYFPFYVGLRKNRAWREYCAERYVEVVLKYFNAERAMALFDKMVAERDDEMERQIERWHYHSSIEDWHREVKKMRDIVEKRPEHALRQMADYFGLSSGELQSLIDKYSME